jgi:hypothetical protein
MTMRISYQLLLAGFLAAAIPTLAAAQSMPVRKPGWWEMKMTISGPTPEPVHQTMQLCTDPAVDKVENPFGIHAGKHCPPVTVTRSGPDWNFTGACTLGAMQISTAGHASGDFGSHYTVDITTRINPPPAPQAGETKISMNAAWLGDCPTGTKPGDLNITTKTNVLNSGR